MSDPPELYALVDDEGRFYLWQGERTVIDMEEGEDKERWLQKLGEGKVVLQPFIPVVGPLVDPDA